MFGSVPPTHSTPVGVVPLTTWTEKLAPGARSFGPQVIVWDGAVPLMTQLAPPDWLWIDQLMPSPEGSGSMSIPG